MTTEQQLQNLKGKRILLRDRTYLVKSARQINSKFLFITDSKIMNLDESSAQNLLLNAKILN